MTAPDLLAAGEQAVFHGPPGEAVPVLEQAVAVARSAGLAAEAAAAGWLLGVALAAVGRYGAALVVLAPLTADAGGPEVVLFGSLAGSTIGSAQRQLGRHALAREADAAALERSGGTGEAAFDALLGLAADAVGLDDAAEAGRRLDDARTALPGRGPRWWRQQVRLAWTSAELALLEGRVEAAADLADGAVADAEAAAAPRHVAKGLLLLGLAEVAGGRPGAAATLRRAGGLAESLGTLPLVWPARGLLGALLAERPEPTARQESAASLAAARNAVRAIAADLPPGVRAGWLARPDLAALLAG